MLDDDLEDFDDPSYKELVDVGSVTQCRYCEAWLRKRTVYHYCGSTGLDLRRDVIVMEDMRNLLIYENLSTGMKYFYKQVDPEELDD